MVRNLFNSLRELHPFSMHSNRRKLWNCGVVIRNTKGTKMPVKITEGKVNCITTKVWKPQQKFCFLPVSDAKRFVISVVFAVEPSATCSWFVLDLTETAVTSLPKLLFIVESFTVWCQPYFVLSSMFAGIYSQSLWLSQHRVPISVVPTSRWHSLGQKKTGIKNSIKANLIDNFLFYL